MKKKIFIVLAIVGVVLLSFYFLRSFKFAERKTLLEDSLPVFFPKDLITDPYVVNLASLADAGKLSNEVHRATVTYVSQKPIADIVARFNQYFKKNNFSFQTQDTKDAEFLFGSTDKINIGITIWKKSPLHVSILYILFK